MLEIIKLHEPTDKDRAFDAFGEDDEFIAGKIHLDYGFEDGVRTYVFLDRERPLDDSYAMRPGGSSEELANDRIAEEIVINALTGMPTSVSAPQNILGLERS
jgi:hypothetical protein